MSPVSPWVGGQLMKGYTHRNMGDTYHGVSQPSNREDNHKKFRSAAAVATRELPPVIKLPQVQPDVPVCLFLLSFFFCWLLYFTSRQYHSVINIQLHTSGLVYPLSKFASSEPYSPNSLLSSSLISMSSFLLLPDFFSLLCQAGRDLTLINVFLLRQWSRNRCKNWFCLSLSFFLSF